MGLLDGILGQVAGNPEIANLAAKIGLSPEQVTAAISALGAAHVQPGDTVSGAADSTGLSPDVLQQILAHLGGEGALGNLGALLGGTGGAGGLGGMLGGLGGMFGKS
ncbi:hypothetical protein NF700_07190 [Sphingomonadaceae bacterium OTU29MARTA1]|uniref:hypothetical protein n=1 Tax=Sphingomonas sp. Leaf37 TaxID=2876552 RepID=UPI001E589148|nr:hypothetical protein [Sphingomonas sp. Leaf37]USU10031.1 hypothetical protein NF700_07190 [Sphingomonadaceae bacterium OTU29MARTA1]USU13481.1 hypothetical protein NF701_06570 [Sphingomonadaceae bacterium OTU29THOMA1]